MVDEEREEGRTEKRRHVRQLVLIPVYVEQGQAPSPSLGLIRNISVAGAYFLTQQRLQPGDALDLTLHLSGDPAGPKRETTATVIRTEELADLQDEIAELAKKLADVD